MDIPSLETANLLLRPFTPRDAPRLGAILHEEGILRYFAESTPPPLEVTEKSVARRLEHWKEYGYGRWAVVPRDTGMLMGWCGMDYSIEVEGPELTYLLSTGVWGRGYATEAGRATVRFGFEVAGLDRIMSMASLENAASNRVLLKCGLLPSGETLIDGMPMRLYRIDRPATQ